MKTMFIALFIASTVGAYSQTLAPELAPHAAKYKAEVATLDAQRSAGVAKAQTGYTTALNGAERNATTAGDVAAVAAIATERAAVSSGLMSPGFPAGLPKELQAPRKTYLDTLTRIRTAEAPRRQAIDAAYLRLLTNLTSAAANRPELARQLEAEKQKLLGSAQSGGGSAKPSAKSAVVNGTFDGVDAEGRPSGWTAAEGFTIARDGTNNVLHAIAKVPAYLAITQDIVLPPKARNVTLKGRVRGKLTSRAPDQSHFGANIAAVYRDTKDAPTNNWLMLDGGTEEDWKTLTTTQKIPDDMKTLQVVLVLKYVSGEFDFDDIEVEFR